MALECSADRISMTPLKLFSALSAAPISMKRLMPAARSTGPGCAKKQKL